MHMCSKNTFFVHMRKKKHVIADAIVKKASTNYFLNGNNGMVKKACRQEIQCMHTQ